MLDTFVIPKSLTKVSSAVTSTNAVATASADTTDSDTTSAADESSATTDDVSTGYTEDSYTDDNMSITITQSTHYDTQVYVVDIVLSDVTQLKTAFAEDTYGRNIKQTTSTIATNNNAILAINGDYYGFRNSGYVLRNAVLYRDSSQGVEALAIMSDGSFSTIDETATDASSVAEEGAWQIFSFGPVLVNNGTIAVDEDAEVAKSKASNPRTAIGMISPLHYVIIVSDGRSDESEGLSLYQLADLFVEEGCTVAYNLDGGGSSTLWFNGNIINNPTSGNSSGEREVSDIVYIGY